jgi:cytosine/adenosine deaminase-related metal-dependent hydrolase
MHDPGPISRDVRSTLIRGARCALGPRESLRASIQITDGRVTSIGAEPCLTAAANAEHSEIDLSGFLIMPGFINAHDHLQFALHPRLADPPYRNYVEWGKDIHAKFPEVFARNRAVPKGVRLWWGGLRNLLCGVTTVSHHDPLWPELRRRDFPVRVVQDYGWGHSVALGGDLRDARSATPVGSAFIVHACEGVDEHAREELIKLDRWGLLDDNTVLVHGLAVDEDGVELIKARGASLIICPSSNKFLFGKLPDWAVFGAIDEVALGSDSPLTSEGDLLDEVRFAMRYCDISSQAAYRMVTDSPAAMLGLVNAEGSIKVSGVGDLIAVRDTNQTVIDGLRTMSMADVEFVMIGGSVQLASDAVFERLPLSEARELEPLWIDSIVRWLRAPVKALLQSAEAVLGVGEVRLGGKPVRIPEYLEAKHAC